MITGLALINEVEDRLGWRQSETLEGTQRKETRKLLRLLNRILVTYQSLDDWPLLRANADLQLVPSETGTWDNALIYQDTNNLLIDDSSFTFDESYVGRAIKLGSDDTIYRITELIASNGVKLNRPWVGDSQSVGELEYTIVQDRYTLPVDFDRPTGDWHSFFGTSDIAPVGPDEFLARRAARGHAMIVGDPDVYTIYGMDESNTYQVVHFDVYPENKRILNYTYQMNHPAIETDEDRILYPKTHEGMIIEAMLQLANRDYEDSQKSQAVLQDLLRTTNQAQGPGGVAQDRLSVKPSGRHRMARHRRWRGGSRIDWGSTFDDANKIGFR